MTDKFTIKTFVDPGDTITQETTDLANKIHRRLIKTQDDHIRKALISLGWTPPEEKKNRDVFRDLCQEVLDYYEGRGKYNFSHLSSHDRDNEAYDAWQLIREKIKQALTSKP
jgi:hypothetical protein